ncbi:cytochrome P450, partial [Streptomyces sp. NPDC048845]
MTSAIDAVPLTSEGGSRLHAQTAELRAAGPAVRVGLPEGVTAWSVTRGDVVKRLMNDSQVSKDARRHWPGYRAGAIRWLYSWVDVQSMLTADGADHARLRTLIGKAFTPRRIEALRPMVERIVNDLLDAMESHRGDASVDLRAHFSYGVPTEVICGMFGVPGEQRADMLRVIDSVLATDVTEEESEAIGRDLFRVMTTLIETKRRSPGDDMTSLLLDAHEDGDRLSEAELVSTLILMIGAGSETAVALINHAVRELLSHPGQLAAVLADPRRWEDVVEETLRLHPPIVHMPLRFAVTDIDLGDGVTIRAGDPILVG